MVQFSGVSWVDIFQGVPEGELLGPLGFNLILDVLTRMLEDVRCGVNHIAWLPLQWRGRCWGRTRSRLDARVSQARGVLKESLDAGAVPA